MNIILLGAPASGKGTQAKLLAEKFNLYHLQTGQIARDVAKNDERIRKIVESGALIPENEMTMYVIDILKSNKPNLNDILFEGFPRFISQYTALDDFLKNKGDDIDAVISLDIKKEVAVERILGRMTCEKCGAVYNKTTNPPQTSGVCDKCGAKLVERNDDNRKTVEKRFEYYQKNTKKLIDYLDHKSKLIHVDADRKIETIQNDLVSLLTDLKNK